MEWLLSEPERTTQGAWLMSADDPGCVKTQKVETRRE